MNESKFTTISGGVCAPKGFRANGLNCGLNPNKEKNDLEGINSVISAAEELTSMTKKALLANLMAIRDSAVAK